MASYQCQRCGRFVDLDKVELPDKAIENILCKECFEYWETESFMERD